MSEKPAEARRLRAAGLKYREISELLDTPFGTISSWVGDPDGSRLRARKDRYGGSCLDCGALTDGSQGRARAPKRCAGCNHKRLHTNRFWTPEQVLEALEVWADRLGRAPTAEEAKSPSRYVPYTVVRREFGSWNAAIEAAGLTPCPSGSYRRVSRVFPDRVAVG